MMAKAWRLVLAAVLFLVAAGVLLSGIAWITGASPARIVELTMGGPEGVKAWWAVATQSAKNLWEAALAGVRSIF